MKSQRELKGGKKSGFTENVCLLSFLCIATVDLYEYKIMPLCSYVIMLLLQDMAHLFLVIYLQFPYALMV